MGDDTAMIKPSPRKNLLVTSDLLVENVDFDHRWSTPYQVGYKTMAANLSDIAAMGGVPRYAMVVLALPKKMPLKSVTQLYQGLMTLARKYDTLLIGGDISSSPFSLMVSVMLLGEIEQGHPVTRSKGRPGDKIFVTGTLGDSNAGLEILKKGKKKGLHHPFLIRRHLYPTPRILEGRFLASHQLVSSMIDLSDGLATDLRHLCRSSQVGARLRLDKLPASKALAAYSGGNQNTISRYGLQGGEDFELLFTVRPSKLKQFEQYRSSGRIKATMIGELTFKKNGVTLIDDKQEERPLNVSGYQHFKSQAGNHLKR